jgi:hypothetical protein
MGHFAVVSLLDPTTLLHSPYSTLSQKPYMGHFASALQKNFQIFFQCNFPTSILTKSNNFPYFLFISCLTYGDDNFDVELLQKNDPVTRRDTRVEVYKHQHVITTMPEDFFYYYISFVFMIVFLLHIWASPYLFRFYLLRLISLQFRVLFFKFSLLTFTFRCC